MESALDGYNATVLAYGQVSDDPLILKWGFSLLLATAVGLVLFAIR